MESKAKAIIVTPVKNALDNTLATIQKITKSNIPVAHFVYNDFSEEETLLGLEKNKNEYGYTLINLSEILTTPSPNYKYVLQDAQRKALAANLPLIIVESDVEVAPATFEKMLNTLAENDNPGLIGAITVDENNEVNFPYLKFKNKKETLFTTDRSLSFCCTLFSPAFLKANDLMQLQDGKDWYDTSISQQAISLGFTNYILMNAPVLHKPHGSRPWKKLKYSNPIKYYFQKFIKGRDKI
jgi:hypothetical protein